VAAAAAALVTAAVLPLWRGAALPGYEMRLEGAVRTERSAPAVPQGRLVFAPGNRFELVLTPARSAGTSVEARAFVAEGDRLVPLDAPAPQRSADGALRIAGVVGHDVRLPAGDFDLLVAVGRPRALPSPAELRRRLAAEPRVQDERWSGFSLRLRGPTP
jgi:hypothetical protein